MESMQTKDGQYRILLDSERFPIEIDKGKWEMAVYHFGMALDDLRIQIKVAYDEDKALYQILRTIIERAGLRCNEGKVSQLDDLSYAFSKVQDVIENSSDTVPSKEEIETIEDIGYRQYWHDSHVFEKTLEDTDEQEVVEEIVFVDDKEKPLHRKRTTLWEKTKYGKASKEIKYEELPIDEYLLKRINNTIKQGRD